MDKTKPKRKAIPKKKRFEVFKRDSFSLENTMDALYTAIGQYDDFDDVVNKMGGICYNKKNNLNPWGR